MKKSLLTLVALVATTAGFAQSNAAPKNMVSKKVSENQTMVAPTKQALVKDIAAAKSLRRSQANGLYYARPAGTYWVGGTTSGGTTFKYLVVPPFTKMTFTNMSNDPSTTSWGDWADEADADNNLVTDFGKVSPGYVTGCPSLTGVDSEGAEDTYKIADYVMVVDSVPQVLYPINYADCHRYYGFSSGGSAFMSGPDQFDFDDDGKEETFYSQFRQFFEKPASTLRLHDVYLWVSSTNANYTAKDIKLVFYKWDWKTIGEGEDEYTYRSLGDKIAEMTIFSAEMDAETIQGTSVYPGTLTFARITTDEFGTETVDPLLLDEQFAVQIEGTESPKCDDVRFYFCDQGDYTEEWYTRATPTYMVPFDANGKCLITEDMNPNGLSYHNISSNGPYCYNIAWMFEGEMEGMDVMTTQKLNEQVAPAEGGETGAANAENESLKTYPAYVYTNYPMFEGEDFSGNYDFEGIPDWAQIQIDPSGYEYEVGTENEIRGLHMVWFIADALPDGVTGRSATVTLVSAFGSKCKTPIYLLQGDAVAPTGVTAVKFDAQGKFVGIYNMAGQQVGNNYKGLVIKNGKKVMMK